MHFDLPTELMKAATVIDLTDRKGRLDHGGSAGSASPHDEIWHRRP